MFACFFLNSKQSTTTLSTATPTRVLSHQFFGDGFINDEAVVIVEFGAGWNVFFSLDKDTTLNDLWFAIGCAAMVDPACRIPAVQGINDFVIFNLKIKGVIWIGGVVGVAFC